MTVSVSPSDLGRLINLTAACIFLRCSIALPSIIDASSTTGHHAFFAKLIARDPALGRAHVFTTNYDTLIEQSLDDLGIRYSDGFVGTIDRRFDPSSYGLDIYFPGEVAEGRVRRFDKFLHLYKPHGSITWRRRPDQQVIHVPDPRLDRWKQLAEAEGASKLGILRRYSQENQLPIGILPTDNKFAQTLGMPYAHLFRSFYNRLQEPQTFFLVLGYSFGDDHLNAIINEAMTNPNLVMLVVDPLPTTRLLDRIRTYQQTGERAFLLHGVNAEGQPPKFGTFDDFARYLMPHVKWIDDYVRLRRAEKEIAMLPFGSHEGGGVSDVQ